MSRNPLRLGWPGQRQRLQYAPLVAPLSRVNAQIAKHADAGNLPRCLQLASQLQKRHGVRPDTATYEGLSRAFAGHGLAKECWRLVEDARAAGIEPDVAIWNQVLRASCSLIFGLRTRCSC